jgi:hypothetical protein
MIFRRRQAESHYVLSGYASADEYEARAPSWEPADQHADVDSALLAAQVWQGSAGIDSTVEVVRMEGDIGRVVRVVDRNGVERIAR